MAAPQQYWFKPGQSGNPKGPPVGYRRKFENRFIKDMHDDWLEHGIQAIVEARTQDPVGYLKVVASLMPKQQEETFEGLSRDELRAAIESVRALLAAPDAGGDGPEAGQPGSVELLSAIS